MESVSRLFTLLPFISYYCWNTDDTTREILVTKSQNGGQMAQIAPVVALHTHANFVAAGVEKRWSRFDHREMHDVFIVTAKAATANTSI